MALREKMGLTFGKKLGLGSKIGLGLVAAHGFVQGMGSQGLTDDFYNLASGSPNIDKEVLGTDLSVFDMMGVIPGPSRVDMALGRVPGFRSGLPQLVASFQSGMLNGKTFSDARAKNNTSFNTYKNTLPTVDGSIVFGAYNSRFG